MGGGPKRKVVSAGWFGYVGRSCVSSFAVAEGGWSARSAGAVASGARCEAGGASSHLGLLEVFEEGELLWQQEEESAPAATSARRAADTMDVCLGLIRRVELDDPVHVRNIEPACRDVGT